MTRMVKLLQAYLKVIVSRKNFFKRKWTTQRRLSSFLDVCIHVLNAVSVSSLVITMLNMTFIGMVVSTTTTLASSIVSAFKDSYDPGGRSRESKYSHGAYGKLERDILYCLSRPDQDQHALEVVLNHIAHRLSLIEEHDAPTDEEDLLIISTSPMLTVGTGSVVETKSGRRVLIQSYEPESYQNADYVEFHSRPRGVVSGVVSGRTLLERIEVPKTPRTTTYSEAEAVTVELMHADREVRCREFSRDEQTIAPKTPRTTTYSEAEAVTVELMHADREARCREFSRDEQKIPG